MKSNMWKRESHEDFYTLVNVKLFLLFVYM